MLGFASNRREAIVLPSISFRASLVLVVLLRIGLGCTGAAGTDPCLGIECSGRGQCIDNRGEAYCQCDTGFESVGVDCVPIGVDGDGDIDRDSGQDSDLDDGSVLDGDIDTADGSADGGADSDIEGDIDPDPCGGDCMGRVANDCTCDSADPCGWVGDEVCDEECEEQPLGRYLVDSDDCDMDRDGMYESLELELARRFEPWLWYSSREGGFRSERLPHFAVEPRGGGAVSIFYALSYFEDYGDPDLGGLSSHVGDSEFIAVDAFEGTDGILRSERVFLSAHYANWNDASAWFVWEELDFEEDDEGNLHPVVYVAEWKHANYRNLGECDMGSFFADHCEEGSLEPAGVAWGRNLGSLAEPLLEYVDVEGNREFYWSSINFCGWQVSSLEESARSECSSPYDGPLTAWLDEDL